MRMVPLVGHPVVQAKAPALLNPRFATAGIPLRVVATELPVEDFDASFAALLRRADIAGLIVTVPFKMHAARHCRSLEPEAAAAGAANLVVRAADGAWHGAMTDGLGLVRALRDAAFEPAGRRGLLVGAGGAGSGIAAALAAAGMAALDIVDTVAERATALADRTGTMALPALPASLRAYDLLINATALGLSERDPLPFDLATAGAGAFVADVIAEPSPSRLQRQAAGRGLSSIGGMEMLTGQLDLIFDRLAASLIHAPERTGP